MNFVLQPRGSNLCGQACVAMITGRDIEHVKANAFGHGHQTRWNECRRALIFLGQRLGPTTRGRPPEHGLALCRLKWDASSRSHFVIWNDGNWLDPDLGIIQDAIYWRQLPKGARITNHIQIIS